MFNWNKVDESGIKPNQLTKALELNDDAYVNMSLPGLCLKDMMFDIFDKC